MLFKDRLKEVRIKNNLTQKDLADKLNSSKSKISMWETGQRDPNSDDLLLLSSIFDVSIDFLLGNNYQSDVISAFSTVNTDGLSDEDIEAVRSIVEALKKKHGK